MSVLLNTDLISVNIEAPDRNQVLTVMADKLNGVRVAKEGFLDALLKREEIYPTGLPISGGVAILIPIRSMSRGMPWLSQPCIHRSSSVRWEDRKKMRFQCPSSFSWLYRTRTII